MDKDPALLEKEAHNYLSQERLDDAYRLFREAGDIYKGKGSYKEAAMCLASAGGSWALKSGEKMFHNSAFAYEEAAGEAVLACDLEYASLLYRQAAINFERDMEFFGYSDCFYRSRECLRRFFTASLITPRRIHNIGGVKRGEEYGLIRRLGMCIFLTFSALIWGHGEKPERTFYSALALFLVSTFFYMQGHLAQGAEIFKPNFAQAVYFSTITFTTVGYGDITPVGAARLAAMLEAVCGIFMIPIFIVGLSRKYLRI